MRRSNEHPIGFPVGVNTENSKEESSIEIKKRTENFSELIMMSAKIQRNTVQSSMNTNEFTAEHIVIKLRNTVSRAKPLKPLEEFFPRAGREAGKETHGGR